MQRERRRYVAAMLKAIGRAASPGYWPGSSSRPDGLRVIKHFEKLNGCAFDPFNSYHCDLVANKGWVFRENREAAQRTKQRDVHAT